MSTKVQITVELLEKLAGIRPKASAKQQQQKQSQLHHQQTQHQQHQISRLGLGGLPLPPPAHFHHAQPGSFHSQREQELQEVIRESKRVGELLLKAGDQELAAVQQQADKLLDNFTSQIKPIPCGPERQAVLECYKQHAQDVLACNRLIDAYYTCAQQAAAS